MEDIIRMQATLLVFVSFIILIFIKKMICKIISWFTNSTSRAEITLIISILVLGFTNIVLSIFLGREIVNLEDEKQLITKNQLFYNLSLFVVTFSVGLGTIAISLIKNKEDKIYFIYSILNLLLLSSNLFLLQYIELNNWIYMICFYSTFVFITVDLFFAVEKIQHNNK